MQRVAQAGLPPGGRPVLVRYRDDRRQDGWYVRVLIPGTRDRLACWRPPGERWSITDEESLDIYGEWAPLPAHGVRIQKRQDGKGIRR
jgi:hypothetical protein